MTRAQLKGFLCLTLAFGILFLAWGSPGILIIQLIMTAFAIWVFLKGCRFILNDEDWSN